MTSPSHDVHGNLPGLKAAGLAPRLRALLAWAYLACGYVQLRNWLRRLRGRVPGVIVNFHRVAGTHLDHWMTLHPDVFDAYLHALARRYRVVSIDEMRRVLARGTNREPIIAITFDDGYRECAEDCAERLARRGMTAAFFVCSRFLDEDGDFEHDRKRGFNGLLKMKDEHLRSLAGRGFTVGSHTVSHMDFRVAAERDIEREVVESKSRIESAIPGTRLTGFAVPFGSVAHCRPEVFEAVRRAGYEYGLSHFDGVNFPGGDTFHLRRVRPSLESLVQLLACAEGWRGLSGLFRTAPDPMYNYERAPSSSIPHLASANHSARSGPAVERDQ